MSDKTPPIVVQTELYMLAEADELYRRVKTIIPEESVDQFVKGWSQVNGNKQMTISDLSGALLALTHVVTQDQEAFNALLCKSGLIEALVPEAEMQTAVKIGIALFVGAVREAELRKQKASPRIEARTAAKWWADLLRTGTTAFDDGNPINAEGSAIMEEMHRRLVRALDPELVNCFEGLLATSLEDTLQDEGGQLAFGVKIHPDGILANALLLAGLPMMDMAIFPWDTWMKIAPGKVIKSDAEGDCELTLIEE